MGKSIDRLAMELANKTLQSAFLTLDRFGFSLAEASEIVSANTWGAANISPNWKAIAATIRSAMECSVRIGNRVDMNI